MSRIIHGTLRPDGVVFSDLPECISYSTELISTGEHAGQIALNIINADNEDCEDTYYGELNFTTMEFEVVIPDTNIFIVGNASWNANVWKFDIFKENVATWLANTFYDPLFYVIGTGSLCTLAFTAGGTKEIVKGMTIYGATSGALAEVDSVDVTSGSWAGGDAAGTLTLVNQSGEFVEENLIFAPTAITLIHKLPGYPDRYWVSSLISSSLDTGNTVLITETINFDGEYEIIVVDEETFQIIKPSPYPEDETSGSCAIYLAAIGGNSSLSSVSGIYHCIVEHTSTINDRPTTGQNWKTYWELYEYVWSCNLYSLEGKGITTDADGNVYVAGLKGNNRNVWKFNNSGGLIWSANVAEPATANNTYDIAVDTDGNIYVVGVRAGNANVWKFDKSGILLWTYDTGGGATFGVAVDNDGNVFVGGTAVNDKNVWKLHSIDTPPFVELVGSYLTGTTYPNGVSDVAVDADGNVYVAGCRVENNGDNDFHTVWKLSNSLGLIWGFDTGTIGGLIYDMAVAVDSLGNVYVIGGDGPLGDNTNYVWKLNSSGGLVWSYNTNNWRVAVDSDDIPYIAGGEAKKLDKLNGAVTWTYPFAGGAFVDGIKATNFWKLPIGHNDLDNLWTNAIAVYDNSLLSSAISSCKGTWGSFLELLISPAVYDKIQFYAVFEDAVSPTVDIDVYSEGAWHDVYEGEFNQSEWVVKPILVVGNLISKARIRFCCSNNAEVKLSGFNFCVTNVYMAGRTRMDGNYMFVQKISVCCGSVWNYGKGDLTVGMSIAVDKDGNVYVASSPGVVNMNAGVMKFDKCGNFVWDTLTPNILIYPAYGITIDADGDIYFVTNGGTATKPSVWKVDNLGNIIWTYTPGAASVFNTFAVAVDKAKYWVVDTAYTTASYVIGDDNKTYHCILNHTSTVDDRPIAGPNCETYWELADVNVYIAGVPCPLDGKDVRKLDSSGNPAWSKNTGSSTNWGIAVDKDGNVFVVGNYVWNEGNPQNVFKFNSSGDFVGGCNAGKAGSGNPAYGVAVDDDGNVYVAAGRVSDGGYKSFWKFDNSLNLLWTYDTGGTTYSVTTDADGNVYVGGSSNIDYTTPNIFILSSFGVLIWSYNVLWQTSGIAINN